MLTLKKIFLLSILFFSFIFSETENKLELKKIEFIGNSYFSSSSLKEIIFSKETPWWFWKFLNTFSSFGKEPVYFDSLNIESDIKSLKEFYNANGFFKSQISYKYEIDSLNKSVSLFFVINENDFSLLSKFRINGLDKLPNELKENIFSNITFDSAKRFTRDIVSENIENINLYLVNNGYMSIRFDSTVIFKDTLLNKANVDIYFSTGKRFIISNILIEKNGEGADFVQDELLKRIVGIEKGTIYNLDKIRQSQIRLFRTGLFNSITILPKIEDTVGTSIPLKLSGNIGLMNELAPELIMNNQQNTFNVGSGGSYIRKNFFGEARKFTISGTFGVQDFFQIRVFDLLKNFSFRDTTILGYFEIRLKIEQPYLFNEPIFGISESYVSSTKEKNKINNKYGSKLIFEFELPTFTFINFMTAYFNYEVVDIYNYMEAYEAVYHSLLSTIGTELRAIKSNDPIFPSRGYNISFLVENTLSIPSISQKDNFSILDTNFANLLFYKLQANLSYYIPLNKYNTTVAATKFKAGYIHSYRGDNFIIPSTRRFYGGGSNSIRGWRAKQLTPIQTQNYFNFLDNLTSDGGLFTLESSVELRYRFAESFGTALFVDFGNVWNSYKDFRFDDIAVATGFGLRYYTTIAPFRIDFGFKLFDPNNRINIFQKKFFDVLEFHFGIGESF